MHSAFWKLVIDRFSPSSACASQGKSDSDSTSISPLLSYLQSHGDASAPLIPFCGECTYAFRLRRITTDATQNRVMNTYSDYCSPCPAVKYIIVPVWSCARGTLFMPLQISRFIACYCKILYWIVGHLSDTIVRFEAEPKKTR